MHALASRIDEVPHVARVALYHARIGNRAHVAIQGASPIVDGGQCRLEREQLASELASTRPISRHARTCRRRPIHALHVRALGGGVGLEGHVGEGDESREMTLGVAKGRLLGVMFVVESPK